MIVCSFEEREGSDVRRAGEWKRTHGGGYTESWGMRGSGCSVEEYGMKEGLWRDGE